MLRVARPLSLALALVAAACVRTARPPRGPARGEACACRGHPSGAVNRNLLCRDWRRATESTEDRSHVAFPELDPRSCYTEVRHSGDKIVFSPPATEECGYTPVTAAPTLEHEAIRFEAIAKGETGDLPLELSCELPPAVRAAAAKQNARVLRTLLATTPARTYPYALVGTFGYGAALQKDSPIANFSHGDACVPLTWLDKGRLQPNVTRATNAAAAYHAGVAPVITVSGGAVHSSVYEANILFHLLVCDLAVPPTAILVDPCANHTHTNVRNTAGFVVALGGRAGYVVTDSMQAAYLEDWTPADFLDKSIDDRSLRDFGYLPASYRRASVGAKTGFWLTPYRFFGEPRDGLGGVACAR